MDKQGNWIKVDDLTLLLLYPKVFKNELMVTADDYMIIFFSTLMKKRPADGYK